MLTLRTRLKEIRASKVFRFITTALAVLIIPIVVAGLIYLLALNISTDRRITRLELAAPCALHKVKECRKNIEGFLTLLTPSQREKLASELFAYLPTKKGRVIVERILIPSKSSPGSAVGRVGARGLRGLPGLHGLNGARGANGSKGLRGSQGSRGIQGSQGQRGAKGSQGIRGPRGPQGPRGPRGQRGPVGLPGPIPTLSQVCAHLHLPPGLCH